MDTSQFHDEDQPIEVNLTTINSKALSLADLRRQRPTSDRQIFQVPVGEDFLRKYMYIKEDTTGEDDNDLIIVTNNGKRFHRVNVYDETKKKEDPIDPPIDPPPSEVKVLDTKTYKDGRYEKDTMSGFKNVAGEKQGNAFYSDAPDQKIVETIDKALDIEIECGIVCDRVVLRKQDNGNAIMFSYKMGGSSVEGGRWMAGLVNNGDTDQYPVVYFDFDEAVNKRLFGFPNGKFIFGCKGPEVYAKYNNVEFFRTTQIQIAAPGTASVIGFEGNTWVDSLKVALSGSTGINTIDSKNIGITADSTTGSAVKGSKVLKVKDSSFFKVGSLYGIEAKTLEQASGGIWPEVKSYADDTELIKANPQQAYAWVRSDNTTRQHYVLLNGETKEWEPGMVGYTDDYWWPKNWEGYNGDNYIKYPIPLQHRFRVESINTSTNEVVMDAPVQSQVTDALIFTDIEEAWNTNFGERRNLQQEGVTLRLPEGVISGSELLNIDSRKKFSIIGAGIDKTIIRSPKGVVPATLSSIFCPGLHLADFTLEANYVGEKGHGLRMFGRRMGGNEIPLPGVNYISLQSGGLSAGHSDSGLLIERVRVKNTITAGFLIGQQVGGLIKDCHYHHDTGVYRYTGWCFNATDGCIGVTFDGCTFFSPLIFAAFESFGGEDNAFLNCISTNGRFSSNTSQRMRMFNTLITLTENSRPGWMDLSDPVININANSGRENECGGAKIEKTKIHFEGFIDTLGNYKRGVTVQKGIPDVVINDLEITYAKEFIPSEGKAGCSAVGSDGINTKVINVRCHGKMAPHHPKYASNIGIDHGEIRNCDVDSLYIKDGLVVDNKAQVIYHGPNVIFEGVNEGERILIDY